MKYIFQCTFLGCENSPSGIAIVCFWLKVEQQPMVVDSRPRLPPLPKKFMAAEMEGGKQPAAAMDCRRSI